MAVLETEKYNAVIAKGKEAVQALKNKNIVAFFKLSEEAWDKFPNPKENWNQAYNYSKMVFKHSIDNIELDQAKKWLNRMIDNNNSLHLFDIDIDFNIGKYYFETKDYNKAMEKWKYVVSEAGFRYFESEKPEYLNFYKITDKK